MLNLPNLVNIHTFLNDEKIISVLNLIYTGNTPTFNDVYELMVLNKTWAVLAKGLCQPCYKFK